MNDADYALADAILDMGGDGSFEIEVELDNNTFAHICFGIETESYQEDDFCCEYGNSNGARMTNYASVYISSLDLLAYNDNGDEIPCNIDVHESEIEKYCEQQLLQN